MICYSCKGVRTMTFTDYLAKCEVAKTVFQCGVTAALSVHSFPTRRSSDHRKSVV